MGIARRIRRLKPKKVKPRTRLLKSLFYKEIKLSVRLTGTDMFEYFFAYKGEVYTNYMIITPRKGEMKLSEEDIIGGMQLIWAGGETSIDLLLGDTLSKKDQAIVNTFEGARKGAEKMIKANKKEGVLPN